MARTINYELKAQKIKGQIDELVTALHEEKKNSFDENRKVKIANIDLEELNNIELQLNLHLSLQDIKSFLDLCVENLRIDLSCFYICMAKHLGHHLHRNTII